MAPPTLPSDLCEAYLDRLGVDAPASGDAHAVAALQRAHLHRVPFENLSIHLGEEIVLDEVVLAGKVARDARGGFCYELNGAFGALLRTLGFRVELIEGRVHGPDGPPADGSLPGVPFDHLALRVDTSDGPLLVDVGFGASFGEPLRLDRPGPQDDPNGTFELVPVDGGWVDVVQDARAQYRFDPEPRSTLQAFEPGRRHHTTSPASPFTRRTVCSLPVEGGRITVSNRTLTTTLHGQRTETDLDDDALAAIYRERFGLRLDRLPTIPPA